jgi:hypothetical protein
MFDEINASIAAQIASSAAGDNSRAAQAPSMP